MKQRPCWRTSLAAKPCWIGSSGPPDFGDAELSALNLNRNGTSSLEVQIERNSRAATVTFHLGDWIDVRISGFSHQNVLGGLALRHAGMREVAPWEVGVGCIPGEIEIELKPCFGANGVIRASLLEVVIRAV